MRRSILHPVLALVLTVAVSGCAKDVLPTGLTPGARSNGPVVIGENLVGIDPNRYAMITAGNRFTCVRRNSDAVFCWGQNELNQTGQEDRQECVSNALCVVTPTAVLNQSSDTLRARVIDAGYEHACGLDKNGFAWCWGSGHSGQRGTGKGLTGRWSGAIVVDSLTFPQFSSQTSSMSFGSIGAGGRSTCATTGKDGMFCWGVLGDTVHHSGATIPTQVITYSGYHSVVVGRAHACASLNFGSHRSVDCWGLDYDGQLGYDVRFLFPDSATNTPQPSQFGTAVSDFATQSDFTCVDQLSGIVQCAGMNTYGQMGNGSTSVRGSGRPSTVGGGQLLHGVTTGHTHACALDVNNAAWCWGKGDRGQLGNGVIGGKPVTTPQLVLGGLKFSAIAAGEAHTCAIGTDNAIYCWGNNRSGELGIGYSAELVASSPMRVVDPRR
jgi:alpha-tubulin suppressor-like RCC1 family protein